MSASQRIVQQLDALEVLKDWISSATPEFINKLHEQARKENELTEEEKIKAEAARLFIKEYETRKINLENGEEQLKRMQEENLAAMENADSRLTSRATALDLEKKEIEKKMEAYSKSIISQQLESQEILNMKERFLKEYEEKIKKHQEDVRRFEQDKSAFSIKSLQLSETEAILKSKAKKLRESVADI